MHASAQIIPLPTAAASPVVQRSFRGRPPKILANLASYKRDKATRARNLAIRISELDKKRRTIAQLQEFWVEQQREMDRLSHELKGSISTR